MPTTIGKEVCIMIKLIPYTNQYENITADHIISFFGYHSSLDGRADRPVYAQARENIAMWTADAHELYIIKDSGAPIGFIHIWYKGGNVAWIEDIFVEEAHRGKGTGSSAIKQAEEIIRHKDGYNAVCIDVVPRNLSALKLYYNLGYDTLSMITLRKELGDNSRKDTADVLGYKFRI